MKKRTKERGFTLIEVLAAVMILGMAYVAILQSFSVSMKNIRRIDAARATTLEKMLAFEQLLRPLDDADTPDKDLPLFLEGRFYKLVVVSDEEDDLTTLKLERITD
jgi:prepilin-type N-terminal cleavage/methylation domain-containing protein